MNESVDVAGVAGVAGVISVASVSSVDRQCLAKVELQKREVMYFMARYELPPEHSAGSVECV